MKEFIQSGTVKIIMPFRDTINLNSISFCFTGPLEIMSRNEAKEYNISIINENELYDIIKNPEKVNEYKKRRYKDVKEADNDMSIRITIDDIFKLKPFGELVRNSISVDNECILPKYKKRY